jgi:hypothetical protein
VCARAPGLTSVLDPGWLPVGDVMVDGVTPRRWCCGRSVFLGRSLGVGSTMPGAGRGSSVDLGLAARTIVCSAGDGLEGWVAELSEDVVAAFQQLGAALLKGPVMPLGLRG